jgi:hypothetical protein
MREQFDKKLVEKIKSSFMQHKEPLDPNEWDKFSRAYFKTKKRRIPPYLWFGMGGIAAGFVLAFLLIPQTDTVQFDTLSSSENSLSEKKELVIENNRAEVAADSRLQERIAESIDRKELLTSIPLTSSAEKKLGGSEKDISKILQSESIENNPEVHSNIAILSDNDNISTKSEEILEKTADLNVELAEQNNLNQDPEKNSAQETINEWLNDVKPKLEMGKTLATNKDPFRLGVLLSPQSISNATQSLNIGAGVMSEFSFSSRLKLDVGMAYAKQNLIPSSEGVRASFEALDSRVNQADFSTNFLSASYELSFGQLEIPLNLKYKLMEKDASRIFIISGLSNMVYLNQQHTGTFNTVNFSTSGFTGSEQTIKTLTETVRPESGVNGSGVETGRMFNFSVGYEYDLKNGTFLSVEPFYKMSLGNQTFISQQFAIGGLNLRMNFQFKREKPR